MEFSVTFLFDYSLVYSPIKFSPQALQGGFARCVNVLSHSSKPDEMAVDVCTHICRCYRVSAQFEGCREAIVEVPFIIKDLCRVLYYKVKTEGGREEGEGSNGGMECNNEMSWY